MGMGALGGILTAHALGPLGVGVLAVAFILSDFGRALSSCTHVPSILEYHRDARPEAVFGTSLVIKVVAGAVFAAVILAASPWLASTFRLPTLALVLTTAVILVGSVYEVGAARLEAENRFLRNVFVLGSGSAVGLLAVVALYLTDTLTVYTSIGTTILANLVMSAAAARWSHNPLGVRFDGALAKRMVVYGLQIVVVQLLAQALLQTDTLLVSVMLGNADAGVYNVVFQLTYLMVAASTAMGVALVPALSDLVGRGEDTAAAYQRGTIISLGLSLLIALAYAFGGRFILGVYGGEFVEGYPALLVLSAFGVAAALAVPAASMLTVHGHARFQVMLSVAQLALNVVLNLVLIRAMGITGAAIATMVVFCLGTFAAWLAVRRLVGPWPMSRAVLAEAWGQAKAWMRMRRRGA